MGVASTSSGDDVEHPVAEINILNNINNMIDGLPNTCWHRSVSIPATYGTPSLQTDVTVTIPYEISSSTICNWIELTPHPINSVSILSIQIKSGDSWIDVPGFTSHSQYDPATGTMPSGKPVALSFDDTS